jgi:hypothetical protein
MYGELRHVVADMVPKIFLILILRMWLNVFCFAIVPDEATLFACIFPPALR